MTRMALVVSDPHGSDTDTVIERLDSISERVREATENDRSASAALIDAYRRNTDAIARQVALVDVTRAPIAAALLLLELLEVLEDASDQIAKNVGSEFHGGVELIGAAFSAVMMAVETNLGNYDAEDLRTRTLCNQSTLRIRFDLVMNGLREARLWGCRVEAPVDRRVYWFSECLCRATVPMEPEAPYLVIAPQNGRNQIWLDRTKSGADPSRCA